MKRFLITFVLIGLLLKAHAASYVAVLFDPVTGNMIVPTNLAIGTVTITNLNFTNQFTGLAPSVKLERGNTTFLFPTLTNSYNFGWLAGDAVTIPSIGTNYAYLAVDGGKPLVCPNNFVLQGGGSNSFILFDTNFCIFTNGDVLQNFTCISTNVYYSTNPFQVFALGATNAGGFVSNVVIKNVNISCVGQDIYFPNQTYGIVTIDGCNLFSGERSVMACAGPNLIKNSFVECQMTTNLSDGLSNTIVGLDGVSNIINDYVVVDANGSTFAREYIGIWNGSHFIRNTPISVINTSNLSISTLAAVYPLLLEGSSMIDVDGSIPPWQICRNNDNYTVTNSSGDFSKVGTNELFLNPGPGISIQSNAFFDVPPFASRFTFTTASGNLIQWTNHFMGLPAFAFDFSSLPTGGTNSVNFTNPATGISVTFFATNNLWVTNFGGGPKVLMTSNLADTLMISNIAGNATAYLGGDEKFTGTLAALTLNGAAQITGIGYQIGGGLTTNLGSIPPQVIQGGGWDGEWTNISIITLQRNNNFAGWTNFWIANAPPNYRGRVFGVSYVGQTNAPTLTQLPQSGMFAVWSSNSPANGAAGSVTNVYVGMNSNNIIVHSRILFGQ